MADDGLLGAAGRVADGEVIDWASITSTLRTDEDRAIADELALVQQIALGHRQLHQLLPAQSDTPPHLVPDRSRWGHLDLLNIVGRGSYGMVYRAWDTRLERLVALKLFHGAVDPEQVMQEGRMLARVRHENVVTVYGADVLDGVAGIWMELVHGKTLDSIVKADGPLPAREAAAIGADVARALGAVHAAALLHCDVKAQNVVRENSGRVVLMDLGAGRLAPEARDSDQLGDIAGTPRYMAPELFRAGSIASSKAADIYSLGVLMYYLVSGQFPVDGKTLGELKRAHESGRVRPLASLRPELPKPLIEIVTRMIDADPSLRPWTAADVQSALSAIALEPPAEPVRRSWLAWLLAAAVIVGALAMTLARQFFIAPAAPAATVSRSLAVLPLTNLTGDAANDFVVDGLSEGLIRGFSRVKSVRVPTLGAVAPLKASQDPPAVLSKRLGVQLLLAGDVTGSASDLRVSLRLTDDRGAVRWSETFQSDPPRVLAITHEVVRSIAAAMNLGPSAQGSLSQARFDPRAQTAYYRGLSLSRQSLRQARESIRFFEEAVQIEPQFAAAWAELALARSIIVPPPQQRAEHQQRIRDDAQRAIALDPDLGAGYAALANEQFYYEWDFETAENTFRKALEVEPSYAFARQRLAMLLAALGRVDEAIQLGRESQSLEPLYALRTEALGTLYYYRRDFDNAIAQMQHALELAPGSPSAHYGLGRIYSALGRHEQAVTEINLALAGNRIATYLAELERVYAAAGQREAALAIRRELADRAAKGEPVTADRSAYVAAAEGRLDDAIALLRSAAAERNQNLLWLAVDPRADGLRTDPRFDSLLRDIGLIP